MIRLEFTAIGEITADAPRIKKALNILLPTTFPTAISGFFFIDAIILVTNSGNEVPIAT